MKKMHYWDYNIILRCYTAVSKPISEGNSFHWFRWDIPLDLKSWTNKNCKQKGSQSGELGKFVVLLTSTERKANCTSLQRKGWASLAPYLFAVLVFRCISCLLAYLLIILYESSLASFKISESTDTLRETPGRKWKGPSGEGWILTQGLQAQTDTHIWCTRMHFQFTLTAPKALTLGQLKPKSTQYKTPDLRNRAPKVILKI